MKCPNCHIGIRLELEAQKAYRLPHPNNLETGCEVAYGFCPECYQLIVLLRFGEYKLVDDDGEVAGIQREEIIFPKAYSRSIDELIPEKYRQPFNEANSVLGTSPKASAALSRRLLQTLLWDEYKIKRHDLQQEIQEFVQLRNVPADICQSVDAIRNIGNFAAHPIKYTNTGEIVDVESGEAEWLLEVLEAILDFTFIQPGRANERKQKLNLKLQALGKPVIKS